MKEVIRENVVTSYSLHDMDVISFEVQGDDIQMHLQYGMIKVEGLSSQVDGHVVFHGVDWDFCHVYLFDCTGNTGKFSGEKMMLQEFLQKYENFGFSIIDEVYGYNQTKYWGHLTSQRMTKECIIEIYHTGDMVFVEETEER